MKHVVFFVALMIYVLMIGQNWAHYTAAVMTHLWVRYDGRLDIVPVRIGDGPLIGAARP